MRGDSGERVEKGRGQPNIMGLRGKKVIWTLTIDVESARFVDTSAYWRHNLHVKV